MLSSTSIEYSGSVYARIGVGLGGVDGGYVALQGSFGGRVVLGTFSETALYGGVKGDFVRRNGYTNPSGGFEVGMDYTFGNGLLIGANISQMFHSDFVAVNLPEAWETHFALRIGYSWGI